MSTLEIDSVKARTVSGDGSQLTGVAVAPITAAGAVYLSPRTDGKDGTGAFNDPINASTPERLAAAWKGFLAQKQARKLVFMPGDYFTATTFELPPEAKGLTLSGYGATIFYQNPAATGTFHMLQSAYNATTGWMHYNDDITVEGFELDLGTHVQFVADGKSCGIVAGGARFQIRDVTIRNLTSYSTKDPVQECFAVCLDATNGAVRGVTVDNLVVPKGKGGCTAIGVGGQGNIVSGCIVNLRDPDPNNEYYSFAYGCFGSRNVYSGNVAQGVDMGFAMDNAGNGLQDGSTWRENVFVGNSISASLIGFRIHPLAQRYEKWLIVGNNFHAEPGAMWVDMQKHGGDLTESNRVTGMTFIGNQFTGEPRPEGNFNFSHYQWHVLTGNTFTAPASMRTGANCPMEIYRWGNTLNGRTYDP